VSNLAPLATSQQLVFTLFDEARHDGRTVEAASQDIGYSRKNILVRIVDLGVAARRLLDTAYFIVAQEGVAKELYDVDLDLFKWLMRWNSRNVAHFEQVITEAQKALVQASDQPNERFGSVQLIGEVQYIGGRFRFNIPKKILPLILGSGASHWMSLRITSQFKLSYARAIYDRLLLCAPERKGDSTETEWLSLDEIRSWQGEMGAQALIYKYFKRSWLDPAIAHINEVSDLEVSYDTLNEKGSRKVSKIRFRMTRKETVVVDSLVEAWATYHILQHYGLDREKRTNNKRLGMIAADRATYTDERIRDADEYTRFHKPAKPSAYFWKALTEGWKLSPADRATLDGQSQLPLEDRTKPAEASEIQRTVEQANRARDAQATQERSEEARKGREAFDAATEDQRNAWFAEFKKKPLLLKGTELAQANRDTLLLKEVIASPKAFDALCLHVYMKVKPKRSASNLLQQRIALDS
jgi:hypothetical protein